MPLRHRLRSFLHPAHSSWTERLILLAFLGAVLVLLWFGGRLPPLWQGLSWTAWLLALLVVSWLGWLPLLGPVFTYDLVRTGRRGRSTLHRAVYAVFLLLLLFARYRLFPSLGSSPSTTAARFAENFCYTFLAAQFLAVLVLTPAFLGGIIAEEKDRRTLEFLLATPLRDREILLGKLASRLLDLVLLLLTGLPILSLTQLWGGVDFTVLLWFFAATGAMVLSLAGLSALASVSCRKTRDAVVLTYLAGVAFLVVTGLIWCIPDLILPAKISEWITGGNPVVTIFNLRQEILKKTTLQVALPGPLGPFLSTHVLIAVLCLLGALLRLRALALQEAPIRAPRPRSRSSRPRLGQRPFLWKELWAEPDLSGNAPVRTIQIVLVILLPAVLIVGKFLWEVTGLQFWTWGKVAASIHLWVGLAGTFVALLTLLWVAVRAASSISGERERQTFDNLLTTPLEGNGLLRAKWLGSLWSVRRAWLWLCVFWGIGLLTGGLSLSTVFWLLTAWFVYAGFLAVVGLWFSLVCRTSLRATLGTLLTAAALGIGHLYLYLVLWVPLDLGINWITQDLASFQWYGLSPPMALLGLAFQDCDMESMREFGLWQFFRDLVELPREGLGAFRVGLLFWLLASLLLWWRLARRFRRATGQVPLVRPTIPPPESTAVAVSPAGRHPVRRRWRRVALAAALAAVVLVLGAVGGYLYLTFSAEQDLQQASEGDRTP